MFSCFCAPKKNVKKKQRRQTNVITLSKTNKVGIQNFGNTCYINSVLHCLFSMKIIKCLISDVKLPGNNPITFSLNKLSECIDKRKPAKNYKSLVRVIKKVNFHNIHL